MFKYYKWERESKSTNVLEKRAQQYIWAKIQWEDTAMKNPVSVSVAKIRRKKLHNIVAVKITRIISKNYTQREREENAFVCKCKWAKSNGGCEWKSFKKHVI